MGLFYIETEFGCGIREARSLEAAERALRREVGEYGFKGVRPATEKDVAWVRAMGGSVPGEHR